MRLEKLEGFLKKNGIDADEIKDELKGLVQEEIDGAKKEVKEKVEEKFSDAGQKEMVKKINDANDIPWISNNINSTSCYIFCSKFVTFKWIKTIMSFN